MPGRQHFNKKTSHSFNQKLPVISVAALDFPGLPRRGDLILVQYITNIRILFLTSPTKEVRTIPTRTTTLSSGLTAGRTLRL